MGPNHVHLCTRICQLTIKSNSTPVAATSRARPCAQWGRMCDQCAGGLHTPSNHLAKSVCNMRLYPCRARTLKRDYSTARSLNNCDARSHTRMNRRPLKATQWRIIRPKCGSHALVLLFRRHLRRHHKCALKIKFMHVCNSCVRRCDSTIHYAFANNANLMWENMNINRRVDSLHLTTG
jgi:hypothetical protein